MTVRSRHSTCLDDAITAANKPVLLLMLLILPYSAENCVRYRSDATDVAIYTSFGPCRLASFKVMTDEVASTAQADT